MLRRGTALPGGWGVPARGAALHASSPGERAGLCRQGAGAEAAPCLAAAPCPRSVPRHLPGGADGGGTDGEAGPAVQHLLAADQPDLQARSDGDTRADQRRGSNLTVLLIPCLLPQLVCG